MRKATTNELNKVKQVLKLLRKDPDIFPELEIGIILKDCEFDDSYESWLSLIKKLDNEHEQDFFKASWVPICFDKFVFIDVAKEDWCIFVGEYNCYSDEVEEHYWYKNHFFIDMEDLLTNIGDFEYLKRVRNENRDQKQNDIDVWLENL